MILAHTSFVVVVFSFVLFHVCSTIMCISVRNKDIQLNSIQFNSIQQRVSDRQPTASSALLESWYAVHYDEKARSLGRPLSAVHRFRVRKK